MKTVSSRQKNKEKKTICRCILFHSYKSLCVSELRELFAPVVWSSYRFSNLEVHEPFGEELAERMPYSLHNELRQSLRIDLSQRLYSSLINQDFYCSPNWNLLSKEDFSNILFPRVREVISDISPYTERHFEIIHKNRMNFK